MKQKRKKRYEKRSLKQVPPPKKETANHSSGESWFEITGGENEPPFFLLIMYLIAVVCSLIYIFLFWTFLQYSILGVVYFISFIVALAIFMVRTVKKGETHGKT